MLDRQAYGGLAHESNLRHHAANYRGVIMQAEFWQQRWARNEIGFHAKQVNDYLQRFWQALQFTDAGADGSQILVPLCGKSLDMAWLAAQGHKVLGVELAETAAQAFFAEQQLTPGIRQEGAFTVYSAGPVEIYCGDFFALTAEQVSACVGFYDRAALIALPPEMRERYAAHLLSILPAGAQGLLVTLEYDQAQMDGPPFAVNPEEVKALYSAGWQLERLEVADVMGLNWRFAERGLTALDERVYRLLKD